MDTTDMVVPFAGQSGAKSRQAVKAHQATMEMAAQAVMKDGATKVRRYNTFVKHDRRPAKKGSYARRHDDWQRELRRLPQGASAESTICTLGSSSLLLAREDNTNPKVAKPRKASKGKRAQTVHELMMAPGDAVATVQVTLKPEAVPPKIDEKTSETMTVADGTVPAHGEGAGQEGTGSIQGGEASAASEVEATPAPAAGEVAAAPAWDSATPTPRSSTAGLPGPLQRTLSAVQRIPSKVGRAADAAADAVIAAGRDVLAAADRLGDRLRASSTKAVSKLDASWEEAKVVVKEGGSKAAKFGKSCLKKVCKLSSKAKDVLVCGSGSLPLEPVAVRV